MSTPEGKIQLQVIKYLLGQGVFCWRNNTTGLWDAKLQLYRSNPYNMRGVGDIIAIVNGIFISIEIKHKTKQSADQVLFQRRLERNGGKYFLIHSLEEAKEMLSTLHIDNA